MAELILGAIAFGVAVPGIAIAFAQCGGYLKDKVDQYRRAPLTVVDWENSVKSCTAVN